MYVVRVLCACCAPRVVCVCVLRVVRRVQCAVRCVMRAAPRVRVSVVLRIAHCVVCRWCVVFVCSVVYPVG